MPLSDLEAVLELMRIQPRDRILELECGEGELSVVLAARVPEGLVVAIDSSPDRVGAARTRARHLDNVMFFSGEAGEIPWKEDFFSKALSRGFPANLTEVQRVLVPGGLLYLLAATPSRADDAFPDSSLVEEGVGRLEAAGFSMIESCRLPENCTVLIAKNPA